MEVNRTTNVPDQNHHHYIPRAAADLQREKIDSSHSKLQFLDLRLDWKSFKLKTNGQLGDHHVSSLNPSEALAIKDYIENHSSQRPS